VCGWVGVVWPSKGKSVLIDFKFAVFEFCRHSGPVRHFLHFLPEYDAVLACSLCSCSARFLQNRASGCKWIGGCVLGRSSSFVGSRFAIKRGGLCREEGLCSCAMRFEDACCGRLLQQHTCQQTYRVVEPPPVADRSHLSLVARAMAPQVLILGTVPPY
jgi:hypothetical protein